jgi:hypothetical protein
LENPLKKIYYYEITKLIEMKNMSREAVKTTRVTSVKGLFHLMCLVCVDTKVFLVSILM